MSYDLLLTRDKNNTLIGGGYTLNSSFLNSGIPAFTHARAKRGGGKGNRTSKNESGSDSESDANTIPAKVSDIFERANGKNAIVVPAGIFMIHSTTTSNASSSADGAPVPVPVPMKTNLKELLYYGSDSSDSDSDNSYADENENKNDNHVVPDDLYEKLLGLVSPSQVNRYWDPKSTTRKRRVRVGVESKPHSRRQRRQ